MGLPLLGMSTAWAQSGRKTATAQMNEMQRQMLTSLPVFPWLSLLESTPTKIQSHVQTLITSAPGILHAWSDSGVTGGDALNISKPLGSGLLGEQDLKILSMAFNASRKLELVTFMVDRGWKNANAQPLVNRITSRYSMYASPVRIMDGESEATDQYFLFDIGKFVIEIAVPQHGSFLPVYFTTKEIHKKIRTMDGTYDIFRESLEKINAQ
ncbi:hypothetical protein OX89_04225 [Diaphorobacter sp. J5-51]|nr:hypothetical protein OX89_04225 [Diaphorobacter sp. J5-51]